MKKYKVEKTFIRFVGEGEDRRKETKTIMVKMDSRPSLPVLIAMLEWTRQNIEDWLCVEVYGWVKEKPMFAPWKVGVEISFMPDGDVMILYNPMNKIDRTAAIVPDCKFTLLSILDYQKLREKYKTPEGEKKGVIKT